MRISYWSSDVCSSDLGEQRRWAARSGAGRTGHHLSARFHRRRGDPTRRAVTLELDKPVVELGGIHVLYPPDRRPPAKVRVMIDYLAEAFATPQSGRQSAT